MPRFRRVRNGDIVTVPDVLNGRYAADPAYEPVDDEPVLLHPAGGPSGLSPRAPDQPQVDKKPHRNAPIADWRAYAINDCGVPSHEAGSMTKPELIKKVG